MASATSLIQMPEDPMEHILEYLDFPSILVLRKTCHDLRNFIDNKKPASRLAGIDVFVNSECISFILEAKSFHENKNNEIYIDYEKNGDGILVVCSKKGNVRKTMMENEDFVTVFCKDFDIVSRLQKTVLDDVRIHLTVPDSICKEKALGSFNKTLKSMNHPFQVKSLYMEVNNPNEILTVLPYIDPKPLKEIHFSEFSTRRGNILNLDEIGQLEQWKQADELITSGFRLPDLSQNVKHFSKITFRLRPIDTDELILLKKIFLCSSTLHTMKILLDRTNTATNGPKLIKAFGQPFVDTNQDGYWFFRIPDTDQFLRITIKDRCITFNRIEQSDVPQSSRISN